MVKQIFHDPHSKRWKRLRRVMDVAIVLSTFVLVFFALRVLRTQTLPELLLSTPKRNFRALKSASDSKTKLLHRATHRRTSRKPSEIPFNTGEGLRAAYYVEWDPASYSSLKQHIKQIDLLFPEWLHVVAPDGKLTSYTIDNRSYAVVDNGGVHSVDRDNKVARTIADAHEDTEIFPLVNNYDPVAGQFLPTVGDFLNNPASTANFMRQVDRFLVADSRYRGLSLDFEDIPASAQPAYRNLIGTLYADLHSRNLRLYINVPVDDDDFDLSFMAAHSDGLMVMNYDQHQTDSVPGPIAAQDWFISNLKQVMKLVPKEKIICSIGNYGYDWTMPLPADAGSKRRRPLTAKELKLEQTPISADDVSPQEAWQIAMDTDSQVELEPKSLNAHFAYDDMDAKQRHQIWFLDATTALNQMRAARLLGIQTFALWRLGSEDSSMWSIWDKPVTSDPEKALAIVQPGQDVDTEGDGDVLRITRKPQPGHRSIEMDDDDQFIVNETMDSYPLSYTVEQYGYHPKEVALSFDDGPDPVWTPKILDILKREKVKGTFFEIGEVAQDNVSVMRRVFNEGHEIGNHTFTHPDISEISQGQLDLELNLTERLFAAKLGVQPLYFRPPYSIDQEPDTNDMAAPIDRVQSMGYVTIGDKLDTNDWDEHPRKSPQEITQSILKQIDEMKSKPWMRGSIILMHDGGGERSATVAALPLLIDSLRAKGYTFVPVSQLIGKTRAEVMPPLNRKQRWQARVDSIAFFFFSFFNHFVIDLFFVGDVLMSARLILVGIFAVIDRLRKRQNFAPPGYAPRVAVLIPAYNEETVIVRTIRSVMHSDYKNLRIIVIDDGSTDQTYNVAREAYPGQIADGSLTVLTKPNAGKAEALNFAVANLTEDIYVGIDADTVIARDAISKLVPHFANPRIGAVAGNAKVGNRVNLWTRWQALEYITSQNFERRALDLFNVVTVVPGAIGAWRTQAVRDGGGYPVNTVAEDADLTMNLLEQGYYAIYEDRAYAFTEAPVNMNGLMRQRFRWSFGILQAVFKHKSAFVRHRAMGLFALPNMLVFQILLPLFSPFIDLMFLAGVVHYLLDRHFHPEAASTASFYKLLTFFMAFLVIDFLASALAFALERKHESSKGDGWLLWHIWIQRFTYRQVFSVVLFKTIKRAIDGRPFSWDKLARTATMSATTDKMMVGGHGGSS
ncbi:MAG: glycosyltransferase [Acidobacteriaceae bacterium]